MHAKISHENGKHSFSQSAKSARYAWNEANEISSRTQCHSLGTMGNFLRSCMCQHWHFYCTAVLEITEIHWNLKELIIQLLLKHILSTWHFFMKLDVIFFLIIAATPLQELTSSIVRFSKCVSLCNNTSPLPNPLNKNLVLSSQHLHDPSLVTSCNAEKNLKFYTIF